MCEFPMKLPSGKRVFIYDFKRPDKFSKDQIRTMQIIHDTFARLALSRLSAQLACPVKMNVAAVDQLTYEEFIRSIPNPTVLGIISMTPIKGSMVMEMDPAISQALCDRLAGLPVEELGKPEHRIFSETQLEDAGLDIILSTLIGDLNASWKSVLDLKASLVGIDRNPHFAQIVPPSEMIILVALEVSIAGKIEGMINLCFPFITIEPIVNRLSATYMYRIMSLKSTSPSLPEGVAYRGQALRTSLELCTPAASLSAAQVLELKKGDLVPLAGLDLDLCWLQASQQCPERPALPFGIEGADFAQAPRYLALKAGKAAGKGLRRFEVLSGGGWEAQRILDSLKAAPANPDTTKAADPTALLKQGLEDLGQRLEAGLDRLSQRLGTLETSQQTLADQIIYGNAPSGAKDAGLPDGDAALARSMMQSADNAALYPDRPAAPAAILDGVPRKGDPRLGQKVLSWVQASQAAALAALLQNERLSLSALVLSHLEDAVAALVLTGLPDEAKPRAIRTLLMLRQADPRLLVVLEQLLSKKLLALSGPVEEPGSALGKVVGILNMVGRDVERLVMESLESSDGELCEEIKKRMFVFEDMIMLDRRTIAAVAAEAKREDLVAALKASPPDVRAQILAALDAKNRAELEALLTAAGPIRRSEADQAGQRIVEIIRVMEEQGKVFVARPDDQLV